MASQEDDDDEEGSSQGKAIRPSARRHVSPSAPTPAISAPPSAIPPRSPPPPPHSPRSPPPDKASASLKRLLSHPLDDDDDCDDSFVTAAAAAASRPASLFRQPESSPSSPAPSAGTQSQPETQSRRRKASPTITNINSRKSVKRRRKVSHACLYCRRSERPCSRCVKRNIGHLCHDEPRESFKRAAGTDSNLKLNAAATATTSDVDHIPSATSPRARNAPIKNKSGDVQQQAYPSNRLEQLLSARDIALSTTTESSVPSSPANTASARRSTSTEQVSPLPARAPNGREPLTLDIGQQPFGYDDWTSNQFQDMHTFHPSYAFNAPEVTNEYNLINNFLNNSLIDENSVSLPEDVQALLPHNPHFMASLQPGGINLAHMPSSQPIEQPARISEAPPSSAAAPVAVAPAASAAATAPPADKTREYFLTAADPAGNDTPEERMQRLLKAKYDAGLLKPFNYVKGYARLDQYMAKNMQPQSRQRILRQIDKFRPKFRELAQSLTDMELVLVEMWFEKCLMEYDRVFASMAIPACCWRRTGEIFRGNKEMAELVGVPIEKLRDGKLAIHELIGEDSIVSYWEKFGTIAFDSTQKAILTSCNLKRQDSSAKDSMIHCCFSFTIRRDSHQIPSLIIGNFLPMTDAKK